MSSINEMMERLEAAAPSLASRGERPRSSAPGDVLALALADIAAHFGSPAAADALTAGLPLVDGRLPLAHVSAAAERAGLIASVERLPLAALADYELPVIVTTMDGGADIVWALTASGSNGGRGAVLSEPGNPAARVELPLAEIEASADGTVLRVRPATALDERGATAVRGERHGWLLPIFFESRRIYAEAIAATLALNVLALALPLFTMNVYDRVLPNAVETTLWALASGAGLAVAFDFLIRTLRATFVDIASRRGDVLLANLVYGRLLGARAPERPVSAGVRANALRELDTLRDFFNSATLTAFGDVPFILLFVAMIFVVAGPLAWIVAASLPIVVTIAWLTQSRLRRLSEQSFRETAQKNAVVVETVVGLDSVKAAGAESWAATKWEASVSDHLRSSHRIRQISNLGTNAIFTVQTLTQIVMIVAGFYLVAGGSLTTGGLIAGTMLTGRAMQPIGQIAMLITRLHQTRLAFRALDEIVGLEQERPASARLLMKREFSGTIACEGVSYGYDKEAPPVLFGVTFALRPGEKVGIIGAIGSGKSTLLKLMHAVHVPTDGRVTADGIPVHQIDPAMLRRGIGYALQGAELFHGTIRSNIALADPGAGDEEVLAAVRAAGALEWILALPKGLETPVRERGAGLSGGQRQSVALARAVFRRPRILLLDEPTSDMDLATELHVVQSLNAALSGCTLVAVSHRPAVLALVDRLIVLEAGRVMHDGKKADVLKELEASNAKRARKAKADSAATAPAKSGEAG